LARPGGLARGHRPRHTGLPGRPGCGSVRAAG